MIANPFITPHEMAVQIATQLRERRLSYNLSQKSLAEHAGISLAVLKKFERTGKISLETLLKLALPLESLQQFGALFEKQDTIPFKP